MSSITEEKINVLLKNIEEMISTMKYGSITLTIHNDQVVQIEKSEKIRVNK